jgi:hypothetical protein
MGTCSSYGQETSFTPTIETFDPLIPSLGSCGALIDIPPGSLVVPRACVGIHRNWDYDFINGDPSQQPYLITKQVWSTFNFRWFETDLSCEGGGGSGDLRSGDSADKPLSLCS